MPMATRNTATTAATPDLTHSWQKNGARGRKARLQRSIRVMRSSLLNPTDIAARTKCGREGRGSQHPRARDLHPRSENNPSHGCATKVEQRLAVPRSKPRSRSLQALLFSPRESGQRISQTPGPSGGLDAWQTAPAAVLRLVQLEADGNAVARISAVVQIISVLVVVQVDVIAVVPIV